MLYLKSVSLMKCFEAKWINNFIFSSWFKLSYSFVNSLTSLSKVRVLVVRFLSSKILLTVSITESAFGHSKVSLMSSNFLLFAAENVVNDSAKFNSVSKVVKVGSPGFKIWTEAPLLRCFSGAVIFTKDRCPQLRLVVGLLVKRPLRGLPLMANLMTIFEGPCACVFQTILTKAAGYWRQSETLI